MTTQPEQSELFLAILQLKNEATRDSAKRVERAILTLLQELPKPRMAEHTAQLEALWREVEELKSRPAPLSTMADSTQSLAKEIQANAPSSDEPSAGKITRDFRQEDAAQLASLKALSSSLTAARAFWFNPARQGNASTISEMREGIHALQLRCSYWLDGR